MVEGKMLGALGGIIDGVEEGIELGEVDGTDVRMCEGTED